MNALFFGCLLRFIGHKNTLIVQYCIFATFGPDVAYTKQKFRKTSCCRQEVLKTDYRKSLCFYKMVKEAVAVP